MSIVAKYKPEVAPIQEAIKRLIPKDGDILGSPHASILDTLFNEVRSHKIEREEKSVRPTSYSLYLKRLEMSFVKALRSSYWVSAFNKDLSVCEEIKKSYTLYHYVAHNELAPTHFPLSVRSVRCKDHISILEIQMSIVKNPDYKHITCPSDYSVETLYVGKHKKMYLYGKESTTITGATNSLNNKVKKLVEEAMK